MDTYEKKYKELVGKIEKAYLYAQTDSTKAVLEEIFPELKESEDEKIRKALVRFHKSSIDIDGIKGEDILAWLEKQESVGEIVERYKNSWYNEGKIAGMAEGLTDDEKYQQGWHDALEKQGEQKPQRMVSAEAKEALYDKPAWSEEDSFRTGTLISVIKSGGSIRPELRNEFVNWLKSLKQRIGG